MFLYYIKFSIYSSNIPYTLSHKGFFAKESCQHVAKPYRLANPVVLSLIKYGYECIITTNQVRRTSRRQNEVLSLR
tara:strand:+ start:954 stop:1181 length:228 start_codon:yes stop_codon:yes gene_type:complete